MKFKTINSTKEDCAKKYNELLMAVEGKIVGETRHQTALRYIQERELTEHSIGILNKRGLIMMKNRMNTLQRFMIKSHKVKYRYFKKKPQWIEKLLKFRKFLKEVK